MRGFVSKRTRQRRREYPPLALAARGSSRDIPCGPPTKKGRRVVARRPVSSWNGRRLYPAAPSVASAPAAAASPVASVASPAASPATAAAGSAAGVPEQAPAALKFAAVIAIINPQLWPIESALAGSFTSPPSEVA